MFNRICSKEEEEEEYPKEEEEEYPKDYIDLLMGHPISEDTEEEMEDDINNADSPYYHFFEAANKIKKEILETVKQTEAEITNPSTEALFKEYDDNLMQSTLQKKEDSLSPLLFSAKNRGFAKIVLGVVMFLAGVFLSELIWVGLPLMISGITLFSLGIKQIADELPPILVKNPSPSPSLSPAPARESLPLSPRDIVSSGPRKSVTPPLKNRSLSSDDLSYYKQKVEERREAQKVSDEIGKDLHLGRRRAISLPDIRYAASPHLIFGAKHNVKNQNNVITRSKSFSNSR